MKNIMHILTPQSKRLLIIALGIGCLLALSTISFIFIRRAMIQQNGANERIKDLENALAHMLADAKKIAQAQDKNQSSSSNDNKEAERLKKELDQINKESDQLKKELQEMQQKKGDTTEGKQVFDPYDGQPENDRQESPEEPQKKASDLAKDLKEKAAMKKMLDEVLDEERKENPGAWVKPAKKTESTDQEGNNGVYYQGNAKPKEENPIEQGKAMNKFLDEALEDQREQLLNNELEDLQKRCLATLQDEVRKKLS